MIESNLNSAYHAAVDFSEIFKLNKIPSIIINDKFQILVANDSAGFLLGYCPKKLSALTIQEIFPGFPCQKKYPENGNKVLPNKEYEGQVTQKSGKMVPVQFTVSPVNGSNNNPHTQISFVNICDRQSLKNELSLLMNNTDQALLWLDKNLKIKSYNNLFLQQFYEFRNTALEKEKSIFDYLIPGEIQYFEPIYKKVLSGTSETIDFPVATKYGARTFQIKYRPMRDSDDEVSGIMISSTDISEQVELKFSRTESEMRYHKIFSDNPVPSWMLDAETLTFLEVNKAAIKKYGYSKEEFYQMTAFDLQAQVNVESSEKVDTPGYKKTSLYVGTKQHILKNGELITVKIASTEVEIEKKKNLLVMALDISELDRVAKQNDFEKRHNEALINSTNDQIWSLSPQYELLAANISFIELLERETGITYQPGDNLLYKHSYTGNFIRLWKSDFEKAVAGEKIIEIKHIPTTEFSIERWVEIKCDPIIENDIVIGVVCYSRNISERMRAEELLRESETNLAEAQQLAKLGNWHCNIKTGRLTWSKELYNITGIDVESKIRDKTDIEKYIDKHDRKIVRETGETVRKTGNPYTIVYRIITPTGQRKILEENGYGVKDASGKVISLFGTAQDITESKMAEDLIKNALLEKETILESIGDAFFAVDENWIVTYWNQKAVLLLGKSKEEMKRKNFWEIFDKAKSTSYEKFLLARERDEVMHFEDFYESLNKWFEIGAYPSSNGLSVYFKDITPRKNAEENLRIINERYNLVAQATNDSIWDLDIEVGTITRAGGGFKLLFGYENDFGNDINYTWDHLVHPDDLARVKNSEIKVFSNPEEYYWEEEYRFLKADGNYTYVNDRGFIIRDSEGKAIRFIGATQDISRQKEHVQEVTRIQQNLDALINTTSDVVWSLDTDYKIITSNKAFKDQLFSVTNKEVEDGKRLPEGIPTRQLKHWNSLLKRAFAGERFSSEENVKIRKDSELKYFLVTFSPMKNKEDKVIGIACFGKDITDLKRSANLLKKSEKRFSELFQLSPQPMWLYDSETYRFIEVNKAMTDHYGYSEKELLQLTIMDIRPESEIVTTKEIIAERRLKKDVAYYEKFKHIKKGGDIIDVQVYSNLLVVNEKKYTMVIAIDVTEKIRYEQKITKEIIKAQENERYEIGGELHDNVCQLLATSKMNLDMLKNILPPQNLEMLDQSKEYILMALNELRNISHRLAPAVFNERTMEEAFIKLLIGFNVGDRHNIDLYFDEAVKTKSISQELQLNLYRILQEQLRNISKYANAEMIKIEVIYNNNSLKMQIADNGKGFNTETVSDGIGMENMKRRTELFNGKFEVISSAGNGCEILVTIPM